MATLTCEIPDACDGYYYDIVYEQYSKNRARKCKSESCEVIIKKGAECCYFDNYRSATEWEIFNIGLTEVKIANSYYCEDCSDLIASMSALGYLVLSYDDFTGVKNSKECHE